MLLHGISLSRKILDCAIKSDAPAFQLWRISQRDSGEADPGKFLQFLALAKGSACEVISHVHVALDQKYISQQEFERLNLLAEQTVNLIGGLMRYLQQSTIKGAKFKR
jgi:hypothetical protein